MFWVFGLRLTDLLVCVFVAGGFGLGELVWVLLIVWFCVCVVRVVCCVWAVFDLMRV